MPHVYAPCPCHLRSRFAFESAIHELIRAPSKNGPRLVFATTTRTGPTTAPPAVSPHTARGERAPLRKRREGTDREITGGIRFESRQRPTHEWILRPYHFP